MSEDSQEPQIEIEATLTCPVCETQQHVIMPIDKFQHYYKCTSEECLADLAPLPDKCCVFCSYADKVCPQRQLNPEITKHQLHSLI